MNHRIIARLDIKQDHVIKGLQMEGWRKVGNPRELAIRYYLDGADELFYNDAVASLYQRNSLTDILIEVAKEVFLPITACGGISDIPTANSLLRAGADKLAINTNATRNPALIEEISCNFGSQATVLSIEAKKINDHNWEVMIENGRNHTGINVEHWVESNLKRGIGEIIITSVDRDGVCRGPDIELVDRILRIANVPVIASGGVSSFEDCAKLFLKGTSGVGIGAALHKGLFTITDLKKRFSQIGAFGIRPIDD